MRQGSDSERGPWTRGTSATRTVRNTKSQAPRTCWVRRSRGGAGDRER